MEKINKRDRKGFLASMADGFRHETERDYLHVWGLIWGFISYLPREIIEWDKASDRQQDAEIHQDTYAAYSHDEIFAEIARVLDCDITGVDFDREHVQCLNTDDSHNLTIAYYDGDWFFTTQADAIEYLEKLHYAEKETEKKTEILGEIESALESYENKDNNGETWIYDLSEEWDGHEEKEQLEMLESAADQLGAEYTWIQESNSGFVSFHVSGTAVDIADVTKIIGAQLIKPVLKREAIENHPETPYPLPQDFLPGMEDLRHKDEISKLSPFMLFVEFTRTIEKMQLGYAAQDDHAIACACDLVERLFHQYPQIYASLLRFYVIAECCGNPENEKLCDEGPCFADPAEQCVTTNSSVYARFPKYAGSDMNVRDDIFTSTEPFYDVRYLWETLDYSIDEIIAMVPNVGTAQNAACVARLSAMRSGPAECWNNFAFSFGVEYKDYDLALEYSEYPRGYPVKEPEPKPLP